MDIKEEYAKKILDYLVTEGKLTEEDLKKVKSAIPSPLVEDAMRIIHALCCIRQHDTTDDPFIPYCDFYAPRGKAKAIWVDRTLKLIKTHSIPENDLNNILTQINHIFRTLESLEVTNKSHLSFALDLICYRFLSDELEEIAKECC